MQMAERASDGAEVKRRKTLRDVGVVQRFLLDGREDFGRQRGDRRAIAGFTCRILLAVHVIIDPGLVGVSVSDALIVLARDAFRNGGIDAYFRAGRYHTETLR